MSLTDSIEESVMPLGIIFWILMILWFFSAFPGNSFMGDRGPLVSFGLGFVLFFLLGWKVFGFVIQ